MTLKSLMTFMCLMAVVYLTIPGRDCLPVGKSTYVTPLRASAVVGGEYPFWGGHFS
jgi:hypothetical protein